MFSNSSSISHISFRKPLQPSTVMASTSRTYNIDTYHVSHSGVRIKLTDTRWSPDRDIQKLIAGIPEIGNGISYTVNATR